MAGIREVYQRINASLKQYTDAIKLCDNEINECLIKYQTQLNYKKQEADKKVAQLNENKRTVNTFSQIAQTHTTDLRRATTPRQYNNGALSRLAVQINEFSRNDMAARELYFEAGSQLLWINQEIQRTSWSFQQVKSDIDKLYASERNEILQKKAHLTEQVSQYLQSPTFTSFVKMINKYHYTFAGDMEDAGSITISGNAISIGEVLLPICSDEYIDEKIKDAMGDYYYLSLKRISMPYFMETISGGVHYFEYTHDQEGELLDGLQQIILNIARYFGEDYTNITYVDPVRYNGSSLGCFEVLSHGPDSYIDAVPANVADVQKTVLKAITALNGLSGHEETDTQNYRDYFKRMFVFHNYPEGYESKTINMIRQLCVNAAHYKYTIILTHNVTAQNSYENSSLTAIRSLACNQIYCQSDGFYVIENEEKVSFSWYLTCDKLPKDIEGKYLIQRFEKNMNNDYAQRIGFGNIKINKGYRRIEDIPVGVDQDGKIVTLDMENEKFAVFLCGASRSGKSTMLHSLITSVLQKMHPDDVEIWLADFKLMEFSRYIDYLPPHVRYLLLDESPELAYDIIDRLTEILHKRQKVFMGKWQKLSDVPADKYMPAIFVIIDEFSIMSGIIADESNYKAKLQDLLAKGAAAGMHFIFASQKFTDGTKALTDFSKEQIQQRIAMKATYDEIRATLDIRSLSEDDIKRMEELTPHYSLLRIPEDKNGNHLVHNHVLYISDYKAQEKFIEEMATKYTPKDGFEPHDEHFYIDKKPLIINGNQYSTMKNVENEIHHEIQRHLNNYEEGTLMFAGEPKRMVKIWPFCVSDSFCENVLVIGSAEERDSIISIMISLNESLKMQEKAVEYWSLSRDSTFKKLKAIYLDDKVEKHQDTMEICNRIRAIKKLLLQQDTESKYIVIFGLQPLMVEMEYLAKTIISEKQKGENTQNHESIDEPEDEDLMTQINQAKAGERAIEDISIDDKIYKTRAVSTTVAGVSEDLSYILKMGPHLGYHFIVVLNTVMEFKQCKLDPQDFRHKILFRMPKTEAMEITTIAYAAQMENVAERCYRYSNGLDSCTFRPYLYRGLSWDGWEVGQSGEIHRQEIEEEYLM